jgi:hypothetical protein
MKRGRKGSQPGLPNPLEKREVLYSGETDPEILVELGERFRAEGYLLDALNFFAQAGSRSHLEKFLAGARADGDAFLVEQAALALGRELSPGEWEEVAERADELGKSAFAQVARLHAKEGGPEGPDPAGDASP